MTKIFWGEGESYNSEHFAGNSDVGIGNFSKDYHPLVGQRILLV